MRSDTSKQKKQQLVSFFFLAIFLSTYYNNLHIFSYIFTFVVVFDGDAEETKSWFADASLVLSHTTKLDSIVKRYEKVTAVSPVNREADIYVFMDLEFGVGGRGLVGRVEGRIGRPCRQICGREVMHARDARGHYFRGRMT